MSDLCKNAVAFLQKRFPVAPVLNTENICRDSHGNEVLRIWTMIAQDSQTGMKQRAIAVENLGSNGEIHALANSVDELFFNLDSSIYVRMGNTLNPTGHEIDTIQMVFAPRVVLYTNKLCVPLETVIQIFNSVSVLIDIVDESEMHKTLFISYGGPDEKFVTEINRKIKSKGVKTWFFPDDANPGEKLHRMMHDGVNDYDRVLLVCSRDSLSRPGVLNEIERVLEREAKEGGSEILIPIALDDYVYGDWAPSRGDVADQIRSRVIIKVKSFSNELDRAIDRLVRVLKSGG